MEEEKKAEDEIIAKVENILSKAKESIIATMDEVWDKYGLDGAYWGYKINLSFKLYDRNSSKSVNVESQEEPLGGESHGDG